MNRLAALLRAVADPLLDRVGPGVEEFVDPLPLVGRKRGEDVVGEAASRRPDPDPEPAELLGVELVDDRTETVMAAGPAALPEPELAERQGEVVGDDEEIDQRRVLAGEDLPDGVAREIHEGQRLDDHEVEPAVAAHGDRRSVARSALALPAGAVGDPVEDHPADVVARLRILVARVAQADDDLHPISTGGAPVGLVGPESHAEGARSRPGGPAAMVAAIGRRPASASAGATRRRLSAPAVAARARASRPLRPARRGPTRRRGACHA